MYGETPLTTLDKICCECGILSHDVLYDLGCGPGRTSFWIRKFIGCKVIGIDYVPLFIERARNVAHALRVDGIEFIQEDMLCLDYQNATVIYLYGTCLEDDMIVKLTEKFSHLRRGSKIISVSYPLNEYCKEPFFEVKKRFFSRFPWGEAEVFLQIRK